MQSIKFSLTENQLLILLEKIGCEDMGNNNEIYTNNNENDLEWLLPLTDVTVAEANFESHIIGIYYIHFLDTYVLTYYIDTILDNKEKLEELTYLINKYQKDWDVSCHWIVKNKLKDLGYIIVDLFEDPKY